MGCPGCGLAALARLERAVYGVRIQWEAFRPP